MREKLNKKDMKLRLAIALLDHVYGLLRILQPIANIEAVRDARSIEEVVGKVTETGIFFDSVTEISRLWGLYHAFMALPLGDALRKNWLVSGLAENGMTTWRPTIPEMFDQLAIWSKTMKSVLDGWGDGNFKPLPEVAAVFERELA